MHWLEWEDEALLALCLWREARGEGYVGMAAVACVIKNRMRKWNQTLRQVVLARNQFTSMSVPSDAMYERVPVDIDLAWQTARGIAKDTLEGKMPDATDGALYYANLKTMDSGWFRRQIVGRPDEHRVTCQIGHHTFFA